MMAGPIVGDAASPRAGVPISLSVLKDQRHYGNAALDISSRSTAPGRPPPSQLRCGDLPAPPKLGVVDLIAPHNMQPDQERSGDRHLGPRCPAPMLDPPRLGGSRRDAFDCIGCDRVGSDGCARESFSRVWEDWQVMSRGREPGSHEGGRPRRRRMLMLTILLSSGGWAVMGPGLRTSSPAWSVVGPARPVKRGSFLAAHTSKSRPISSAGAE